MFDLSRRLFSHFHPRFFLTGKHIVWSNGGETQHFSSVASKIASGNLKDILRIRFYTRFLLPRIPARVSTRAPQARTLLDTWYGTQH
jgi:hypothetical protein